MPCAVDQGLTRSARKWHVNDLAYHAPQRSGVPSRRLLNMLACLLACLLHLPSQAHIYHRTCQAAAAAVVTKHNKSICTATVACAPDCHERTRLTIFLLLQIARVTKMLADEYGTASNIKSRVNRLSVLSAITSAQQRLKLYNRVRCAICAIVC